MLFSRFTIFLAISAGIFSCRNYFKAATSSQLTGVIAGKGLQVSVINPETRAKNMVFIPYFPPHSNGINSTQVYFKALAFINGKTIFDANYYTFSPGYNTNSGFFRRVKTGQNGYGKYEFIDGKPSRYDYIDRVYKRDWGIGDVALFMTGGDVLIENQVLDNRRPTADMKIELFVPVHGLMSNGFDFAIKVDNLIDTRLEGGMNLKTTSHYVRNEANGDVIILAKTNFIDDLVIRDAIGLPVYSSDQHKVVGFVESYARGRSKTGEMNLRILSIHSPRLKATLNLWELTSQVKIIEEISDQWKRDFCSKKFVEESIKRRLQENKSPTRCQSKQPVVLPKAPWHHTPGNGWCNADSVIAAIEAAVVADDFKKHNAAACCTVSTSKPTWITDSFEEDEIRKKYCDPNFVREAIALAIANDKACNGK